MTLWTHYTGQDLTLQRSVGLLEIRKNQDFKPEPSLPVSPLCHSDLRGCFGGRGWGMYAGGWAGSVRGPDTGRQVRGRLDSNPSSSPLNLSVFWGVSWFVPLDPHPSTVWSLGLTSMGRSNECGEKLSLGGLADPSNPLGPQHLKTQQ